MFEKSEALKDERNEGMDNQYLLSSNA